MSHKLSVPRCYLEQQRSAGYTKIYNRAPSVKCTATEKHGSVYECRARNRLVTVFVKCKDATKCINFAALHAERKHTHLPVTTTAILIIIIIMTKYINGTIIKNLILYLILVAG